MFQRCCRGCLTSTPLSPPPLGGAAGVEAGDGTPGRPFSSSPSEGDEGGAAAAAAATTAGRAAAAGYGAPFAVERELKSAHASHNIMLLLLLPLSKFHTDGAHASTPRSGITRLLCCLDGAMTPLHPTRILIPPPGCPMQAPLNPAALRPLAAGPLQPKPTAARLLSLQKKSRCAALPSFCACMPVS